MEVLQVCGIIKQLIFIHFYFRIVKADFCSAIGQNIILFFVWTPWIFFISFCIYNVGIIC